MKNLSYMILVIAYICEDLSSEILMVKITAHLVYLKKIN